MQKEIYTWDDFSRAFVFGNYASSLDDYEKLVAAALADFPDLQKSEIQISKVTASEYRKGFALIHFRVPVGTTREGWEDRGDRFDFHFC